MRYLPGERICCFLNYILFFFLRVKIDFDKIPQKEDYTVFITQKTSSKENMNVSKTHNFCFTSNLPYGYPIGKKIITFTDEWNTKRASDREKAIYLYNDDYSVKWKSNRVSLAKAVEDVREKSKYEEEILSQDNFTVNNYDYNPKKLPKLQYWEFFWVYDTETFADEENGDCEPKTVGLFPVSKTAKFMVYRDSAPHEIGKKETVTFAEESEDCVDKRLNHINKKQKSDPKNVKKWVSTSYDIKLIAHNAV